MGLELFCLSLILYHEARGEPRVGQLAVAEVVLNRVMDNRYPNSVCEVMEQEHNGVCHFSFWCDGLSDNPENKELWEEINSTTKQLFYNYPGLNLTQGATHYHHIEIYPIWAENLTKIVRIENHIFYRWER
tara:strand:- start:350 stop:742 length:393 start_codon:yes stop_codon:yes gene_type:complete